MRPTKAKQQKAGVKLPSIGNRTFGDMSTQSLTQKQRPSSSKNIVNDLEKKLFSQLDAYQQKASTLKNTRKSINKNNANNKKQSLTSNPTNAYLISNSCKQITNMNLLNTNNTGDFNSMQKLAQLMPQLYSKIINNKKYEQDCEPLKESHITNNTIQSTLITEIKPQLTKTMSNQSKNISKQLQPSKNSQKSKTIHSNTNARSLSISRTKQQKQSSSKIQTMDSFAFAQNEVNKIYKQYLQQQGLEQDNYDFTSMDDLHHMNNDLQKCQVDIQLLQKNYQKLIRQLGNICINDLQDKIHVEE